MTDGNQYVNALGYSSFGLDHYILPELTSEIELYGLVKCFYYLSAFAFFIHSLAWSHLAQGWA